MPYSTNVYVHLGVQALTFSANMRLPKATPKDTIAKLVEKTLADLGITECADTMIGGPLIKGISGGQRKRTSVGIELITDPSLLFLDEPTSGLDSFAAWNLVKLLKVRRLWVPRRGACEHDCALWSSACTRLSHITLEHALTYTCLLSVQTRLYCILLSTYMHTSAPPL